MRTRRGSYVQGHYRGNAWVSGHYRRGTVVHDAALDGIWIDLGITARRTSHLSPCFICGELVYYYRSESNGFAMFDELGAPWQVHSCWEELRDCDVAIIKKAFNRALNPIEPKPEALSSRNPNVAHEQSSTTSQSKASKKEGWKLWHFLLVYFAFKLILGLILL